MVKSPQIADQVVPRNGDNSSPYNIPFDFSTTGHVQIAYADRAYTTKWTVLVENIDYTIKINLGQGLVYLTDPDLLTNFNFLRMRRIRPAAQPDIYPNAYSGPGLEGKADNHMEVTQQNTSTIVLLEGRDPLDIVPPNNFVNRFTVINSLDPNRLSGSSLEETDTLVKSYKNTVIEGSMHIRDSLTVGQNISASSNVTASQNLIAGVNLTVGNNATISGSLSVTGNAIITADLSVSQDITCNNLTVAINANLNYIYANSAVITVIESDDIYTDKATVSNLETVNHISNDVITDKLTVATTFTIPNTCEFASNGERFGWYMDFSDPSKTNLIIETINGRTVIKNDFMPSGGGIGNINVTPTYVPKGNTSNGLEDSSITDDGIKVTIGNDCFTSNFSISTYFTMPTGSSMVTSGAVFEFDFVGDFENKPYLTFYRTPQGVLNVTNTALPAVDVSSKYDSSGILSGFAGNFVGGDVTISSGTGVVWDGNTYEEVTTSAPISIQVSTAVDSYVLLRWNGSGGLEAYTQTTPPSNLQRVHDIYLYYITAYNGVVFNLFNRFRNLNQQLEQVIDILGLAVPYSDMTVTLNYGTATFIRNAGNFKGFGIKNVPTSGTKYDTSTVFNIADNAPVFTMLDIYRGNVSTDITDFIFPAQYLDNNVLTAIPSDSWGYYQLVVNTYGQVRIIYPNEVFVSVDPDPVDAQTSINNLSAIRNLKVDGFATIGSLGVKGGATSFESATSIYYRNYAGLGESTTIIQSGLPDPNNANMGDRLTVVDTGGGVKEWQGSPDSVKTANVGQEAYYDSTNTISGRNSRIKTGTPGYYAVYDSTGLALEGSTGPTFTSNVKPGTAGSPAYYDTTGTVSSSINHLAPNPSAGDVNKVLGATGVGTIGWVDQATGSGGSGTINPGTIGEPAVYTGAEEISSSTNLLVARPQAINIGQIYTALSAGSAGWRDFTGSIDNVVITKIIADGQQAGDILTTLSKRRIFDSGSRIYDNYTRREILALNGQTISLKQYMGFGLKADIVPAAPQPGDEPPDPIQGTGQSSTTFRIVKFFRTPTNEKYVLEIVGGTHDTTVTGVYLGTINHKTGVITRVHTHSTWSSSGVASRPRDFGMFFVVDVVNNYFGYNIYTAAAGNYHIYFYNLETGAQIHVMSANKWDLLTIPAYITKNDHLYVFYLLNRSVFAFDRIKIQGTTPYFTIVQDAVIINSTYQFDIGLKMMDESTGLLSSMRYVSGMSYPSNITFNFDTNSPGTFYTSGQPANRPLCFGGILYNNKYSVAYYLTNGQANQRLVITPGTGTWELINDLPGAANVGYSYYDQHPKYENICIALKNDKRQLFISYDYGVSWIEKANFNSLTQFWPTIPPSTTGGSSDHLIPSRVIWLDDNNTNMIFTGWLLNGGTNAPCAIQPVGVTAGEATLPNWDDGSYIISTEYQYQPVTWFNAGGGRVIGETYHARKMPLAKAITNAGEISTINWETSTTPPSKVVGFACSNKTIGAWAISDKSAYYAADGYSFGHVYTAGENVLLSQVAYYSDTHCIIATHQTDPFNSTNIVLLDTDGNVQVIYNVSSPYPIISDLLVTDNYVIFSRIGINQVIWADVNDLIFGSVNVGSEIKRLASAGVTTHGLSADGTTIYEWTGKGDTEIILRTFTGGSLINDIVSEPGKLFAVGYTGADGDAYVYNYTTWTDYLGIGTANPFNVVEISTTSLQDIIIGGDDGFFQSSDGFATQPSVLTLDTGSVQPMGVKGISIDTTEAFTVFFGIDENDQGFNYRAGDISTSIITDLIEHKTSSVIIGTSPMGYVVLKQPVDDFWTRKLIQLIPSSTYTQRQTIAEGTNGTIYIQDEEGHIGVSKDNGETFVVGAASPIGRSNRGGAFIGNLLGNNSLMAVSGGGMLRSQDDWATSVETTPFNPDQVCTCFSRDLARNDIAYVAVSQQGTGTNVCRVARFNATDNWVAATNLLDITLDNGRYFTRIASYNDRIVVVQSDGGFRFSIDNGLTWSAENTSLVDATTANEGITSVWIENTMDCVYIAKTGGVFYNTFNGIDAGEPWIREDVPVSADQVVGVHLIDKKRTFGIIGNVGVNIYWRRYDT